MRTLARPFTARHSEGVSEPALDRELVMTGLGLLADVAANTEKILNFLEGIDGEEEDED